MDLEHPKPSSEHSKSSEGREVESVQMDGETFDHSMQDKQVKVFSETIDDSPRSKDSSRESGSSSDSEKHTDEKQIYVINKVESHNTKYSDTHTDGTKSISSSARRRSSCSSSASSSDDFFAMEEACKYNKSGKDYVSSCESADNNFLVPTSTYEVNNLNHIQKGMSPTASPPVQVMDRSGSCDASIVPSSIFEPNTNPSEWSIASNESLFSIQIGQPSFSREKALMYSELYLSKELSKSGELNNQAPSVILEEIGTTKENVDVEEIDTTIKNVVVEELQAKTSYESFKFEGERHTEDNNETKTSLGTKSLKSSKSNVSILSHSDNGILPVPPL